MSKKNSKNKEIDEPKKSDGPEVLESESLMGQDDSDDSDDSLDIEISQEGDEKNSYLPALATSSDLVPTSKGPARDNLQRYLREVSRYPVLTVEEERELTQRLVETGDIEAAKQLVRGNLRLVVKIAMEYRQAYQNLLDLIQEGNIGLMKAVSKYDPSKGAKLSYYASWWIRSYILKFILDNFRLVKIGTTSEQKKLFYNLMKEKDRLSKQGIEPTAKRISQNLGVSERAVIEMDQRLEGGGDELSIDKSVGDSDTTSYVKDFLSSDDPQMEEMLGDQQELDALRRNLSGFIDSLRPRDREIFKKRLLSEVPPTLQTIADQYGVSRERIRQIEERLIKNLKVYMSQYIR